MNGSSGATEEPVESVVDIPTEVVENTNISEEAESLELSVEPNESANPVDETKESVELMIETPESTELASEITEVTEPSSESESI